MKVAYFTNDQVPQFSKEKTVVIIFSEFAQLEKSEENFDCIIVADSKIENTIKIIEKIRKNIQFYLLPIFTNIENAEQLLSICDGDITRESWDVLVKKAQAINELRSLLVLPTVPFDLDTKVLQYTFTRENIIITPRLDWQTKALYVYPLLKILAVKTNDDLALLKNLQDRNLIEKETLHDRLHCCSKCHYAHINYIDTCPSCHSINIKEVDFLHCFTCGHVAAQDDFTRGNRLKCPRCQAVLRHIGSDYDRPIENYHCLDCEDNFSEAEVIAKCLMCQHSNTLDRLVSQPIYSYKMTELGRLSTANNSIADMYNVFDILNYLTPQHFNQQLNWILQLAERHLEINFGILAFDIIGLDIFVQKEGRYAGHMLLEECTERIRQTIRTTDFTTRTSENRLWLLAPQTSAEGSQLLGKRLRAIADLTQQHDGIILTFNIIVLFSGDISLKDETAETLIMKINEDLDAWRD